MPATGDVPPTITLLTDFGTRDIYVGVMKGVIRGLAATAHVIDLSHDVAPQSVRDAAFLLDAAAPYFPLGTIHVAVVDPGVGSDRRILCARTARATYLAPDNGLLAQVLERDPPLRLVSVERPEYFLAQVSCTFHGRDIFAPVAAHLANGLDPDLLGPTVDTFSTLALPSADRVAPDLWRGEVIYIDRFGNLVTNIATQDLAPVVAATLKDSRIAGPLCASYAERDQGALLLVGGSSGYLEVSVNAGSAQSKLGARRGDEVEVSIRPGGDP